MALFKNDDEETQVVIMGAAVAVHALLAGRVAPLETPAQIELYVSQAFAISREFWKQAKQEIGS